MIYRIDIIDTTDDTLVLQNEKTEMSSPMLTYKGSDSVYLPILASQLSFNMLVDDAADGEFIDLFTGGESRYKVKLYDATLTTAVLIWQGYLLTEQYTEPYKNGSLFVSFLATDRIGQLKTKYLPDAYYETTKSVSDILYYILQQTGYDMPLYYVPSIVHALETDITLQYLDFDLSTYTKDGKHTNIYTILKDLLNSLQVTLFQYDASWYCIGVNRWNETTLQADKISTGTSSIPPYIQNGKIIVRDENTLKFTPTPSITMVPPLKEYTTTHKRKAVKNLLPEYVVLFDNETLSFPDYWLENGSATIFDWESVTYTTELLALWTYLGYRGYTETTLPLRVDGTTTSHDDYINLKELFYIDIDEFPNAKLNFEINIGAYVGYDETTIQGYLDNGDYDDMFAYKVSVGGMDLFGYYSENQFGENEKFELSYEKGSIVGKVSIKDVPLNQSGYIDVKINKPITSTVATNPSSLRIENLQLDIDTTNDDEVVKTRNIDYTGADENTVSHALALSTNATQRFLISDNYTWSGITNNYPNTLQELTVLEYEANYETYYDAGDYTLTFHHDRVRFSEADTALLLANPYLVWKQKHGTGDLLPLGYRETGGFQVYTIFGDTWPDIWLGQMSLVGEPYPDLELDSDDKIFVGHEAYSETITDQNYLLDKWKRRGVTEQRKWLPCVSEIPHNIQHEPLVKIQGTAFGLVNILDVLNYTWINARSFRPINIVQNLSKAKTEVTVIETKLTDTQDYE